MRRDTDRRNRELSEERRKLRYELDRLRAKWDRTSADENQIVPVELEIRRVNANIRSNVMLDVLERAEKLGIFIPVELDVSAPSTECGG
jgi:hypothetical protein